MPAVRALLIAGAALCTLVLCTDAANAATMGWAVAGSGVADGAASVDQGAGALVSSVESAKAHNAVLSGSVADPVVCSWEVGVAAASRLPALRPESVGLIDVDRIEPDGSRSRLYARVCAGQVVRWQWLRVSVVTDAVLTAVDEVRRRLPTPHGSFSPAAAAVVVGVPVWFAVPGQWAPVVASARIPAASVTVTATPTVLRFDPGDGAPAVSCAGPGPVFAAGMPAPATPPACSYTYRNASTIAPDGRAWPATLAIDWAVTWAASDGEHDLLPGVTTRMTIPVSVQEIEAVERASR
ncbi:hypothetical protein [Frankia sp. AgB32]|uniref:hypothetical protein n=1 Tax=Frankia sp. AgB32 TaxID=631119 RepID=UPI00200E025A|nr:hypothetical protein [Frankia sp. AgB32]MCK9895041.1 hypothetical protein [Frankia sp. AgB32]